MSEQTKLCIACKSTLHREAAICPQCQSTQEANLWALIGKALKWAGGITAILTLIITVAHVNNLFFEYQRKQDAISRLVLAGNMQREHGDYQASLASYHKALELDPGHRAAQREQIGLSMVWLRNIRIVGRQTFTGIANQLAPILYLGAISSDKNEAADALAHLGWAAYLRYREAHFNASQVDVLFEKALNLDDQNTYAHAMKGFWLLFSNRELTEAQKSFKKALASGQHRSFVRGLQLSALLSKHSSDFTREMLRVVNTMRVNKEPFPSEKYRKDVLRIYQSSYHSSEKLSQLISFLPPKEHLAVFLYLTGPNPKSQVQRYVLGHLFETVNNKTEAYKIYTSLLAKAPEQYKSTIQREAARALARL
ncbi:hypothetical protein ACFL4D_02895 [Candidatus Margulisiibacteriota bacterium]